MIKSAQGFRLLTREAIDNRFLLSKDEMYFMNDNLMPEKYFTVCKDDGIIYLYNKHNSIDEEYGKFRKFSSSPITSISMNGEEIPIINSNVDIPLVIINGYYHEGKFYTDESYKEAYVGYTYKIYIDIPTSLVYTFDGVAYKTVSVPVPKASDSVEGVAKLYQNTGNNTDGSISQSVVTSELDKKFEVNAEDDETLVFSSSTK